MILHANWKHCQRHNGPRNWLRNTDWTLNSQPPLPVEREGMEGFDESQISIEQLWINQLVPRPNRPRCNNFCFHLIHRRNTKLSNHFHLAQLLPRPNRPRCNNFCFHPIHRRNTKLSNHFHSAQGKVASLDNHSHTKLWSPINSIPPITITDAIATFFFALGTDILVLNFWKNKAIPDGGVAPHHLLRFRLSHMIWFKRTEKM